MYKVFVRNWWKMENGQRVPDGCGRKTSVCTCSTIEEAREACEEYNSTHSPGKLSRKAEFMQI
jgi:hypothetical protein